MEAPASSSRSSVATRPPSKPEASGPRQREGGSDRGRERQQRAALHRVYPMRFSTMRSAKATMAMRPQAHRAAAKSAAQIWTVWP